MKWFLTGHSPKLCSLMPQQSNFIHLSFETFRHPVRPVKDIIKRLCSPISPLSYMLCFVNDAVPPCYKMQPRRLLFPGSPGQGYFWFRCSKKAFHTLLVSFTDVIRAEQRQLNLHEVRTIRPTENNNKKCHTKGFSCVYSFNLSPI